MALATASKYRKLKTINFHGRYPIAATTIIAVAARNCNGGDEDVDSTNDSSLRNGKPRMGVKTKKMKERELAEASQNPSKLIGKFNNPLPEKASNGPKPRIRCCPYDFDSKLCKIVDDRVLCGYNRNPGNPQSQDTVVQMYGGCRLRGGRLECGYQHGPFTNPRRPPARNENLPPEVNVGKGRAKK